MQMNSKQYFAQMTFSVKEISNLKFIERCNGRGIIKNLNKMVIAEVGCGGGDIINYLAKLSKESYGFDFSEKSLEVAKVNNKKTKFVCADITKEEILKKYEGKFDLVICYGVLHHIGDDEQAFKNLMKLTKKYLIIGVYNPYSSLGYLIKKGIYSFFPELFIDDGGIIFSDNYLNPIIRFYSIRRFKKMFTKNFYGCNLNVFTEKISSLISFKKRILMTVLIKKKN